MNEPKLQIKLAFVTGLKPVVLDEIGRQKNLHIVKSGDDSIYLDFIQDFAKITQLRSVSRAYLVEQGPKHNPLHISNHKSILGDLIEIVIAESKEKFKSFKITCAGADSPEVRRIAEYVEKTYGLLQKEEADLKIHIIKLKDIWEIGVQITVRPLSLRDYKIKNMSGAMDSTIAYAVNSLCKLEKKDSYLNIFSGSATLLIEAGLLYPNLKKLVGFDNDKKHISLAIQNVRKAGLIKKIQLFEKDIFDKPDLGKFDIIVSDLPFGMAISKGEDLEKLYQTFIKYCEGALNQGGKLAIYTSEHEIINKLLLESKFKIIKTLDLKFLTVVDAYIRPKIFVCEFN